MFELIQRNKRISQVILGLLILPFAFFGMQSYTRSFLGGSTDVAKVNGSPITQAEFAEELRRQQERLRAAFGPSVDPDALDTPASRRALLDSLVAQRVVADAAARARLGVSDDVLRQTIAAIPAFQAEGGFSKENYEALLRAQSMTPQMFEARLRHDLAQSQLTDAIAGTAIEPHALVERIDALLGERREVQESLVAAQPFLAQVRIAEGQAKAYYDANPAEFRVPERVRAEFLVLSADALGALEPVSEAELKAAYEARASQYGVAEQRRASHILVKTEAQAAKLAAEARRNPARFAELARQHSLDAGSAAKGGDLGSFGRGMMVPAFEKAAFAMKQGEISDPVKSEFGWHVIQLTGIEPAKVKPLAEVRDQLAAELRRQKGARRFAEAAEAFGNVVYEQSDSLQPAAERFKLPLQTSSWITRTPSAAAGVLGNAKLLGALFSDDAIKARHNTDAVEVAPNVLVAARVIEHQPQAQKPFGEVRADIERRLHEEEAARLARKAGEAKLAELRKGGAAGLAWSAPKAVSRRGPQGVPAAALHEIMAADPARLPAYAGAGRGTEGYVLYKVSKLLAAEAKTEAQKSAERARAEQLAGARQLQAYVESLRARADVEIHADNLGKKP